MFSGKVILIATSTIWKGHIYVVIFPQIAKHGEYISSDVWLCIKTLTTSENAKHWTDLYKCNFLWEKSSKCDSNLDGFV